MFLLDTNHLKEPAYSTPRGAQLRERLLQSGTRVFTTVITMEEELRGLLARTNRTLDSDERILAIKRSLETEGIPPLIEDPQLALEVFGEILKRGSMFYPEADETSPRHSRVYRIVHLSES